MLTSAQVASFFEGESQMAMTHKTRVQSQSEGTTDPSDLEETWGRIQAPDPNSALGATMTTPTFILGAKSQMRLIEACDLMR